VTTFPVTYQRPGHGNLTANNEREAQQWESMGWLPIPNEPATYELYPLLLYGPPDSELPPLTVANAEEAKAAALKGYPLPSDDDLADGEEGFDAQFATADEAYSANEYPKMLYHPGHRPAVPQGFDWACVPQGHPPRAVPAVPEMFPPVVVASPAEEAEARARGWNIPEIGQKPKKLSGSARRKLQRALRDAEGTRAESLSSDLPGPLA
jgi:hypothetical protein